MALHDEEYVATLMRDIEDLERKCLLYRLALIDMTSLNRADYPTLEAYIDNVIGIANEALE